MRVSPANVLSEGTRVLHAVGRRIEWYTAPSPRFVVVGTGRCGTGYTARVLTEGGIPCGHEQIYHTNRVTRSWRLKGDASWLAVPHLSEYHGLVLHQVRHPISVIRSFVGIGFYERDLDHKHYAFLEVFNQTLQLTGDQLAQAMHHWVAWNEICERYASLTYRVEDIMASLPDIVGLIDPTKTEAVLAAASGTDPSINSRARAGDIRSIDDLPDGCEKDRLVETATRYGYSLD